MIVNHAGMGMKRLGVLLALLVLAAVATAAPFADVKVQKINDRVYALLGPTDSPNKQNGGYMNNNLVIIGNEGVVLVDAGSHKTVAEHIGQAIKTVTSKPVTHVVVTHHHADHHLGLVAFPGVRVISSDSCAKRIEENGRGMVSWMSRRTGLNLGDTIPVVPQTRIPSKSRQAMEIEGVRLELIATETAHSTGDMMVWLPEDGVLASGDILVHTINPNFMDGNLKKWIGVVDDLLKLPLRVVMPGHGPLMQPRDVTEFRTLIGDFYRVVEEVYKSGGAESDVRKRLDLTRWQSLGRYDDMMGGNINKVWLQVEADNF
ncbi:MAG: MBL fold metallo-hydrolase [Burkholderiaceae bacterium]|nr:MBL fold metallo-hydrolase [Burkholderiaceae bacterium]